MSWRELFEVTIASSRKPDFFTRAQKPLYELADPDAGLMREAFRLESGGLYSGRVREDGREIVRVLAR